MGENMTCNQLTFTLKASDQSRLNKGVAGRGVQAFMDDPVAYQQLVVDLLSATRGLIFPIFQTLAAFS